MQLTTDQIDAIRKKFHPDDMPSRLLVRSIAEFLVELLAAHNAGAQEPVGVVHRPAPNGDDFSIEWLRVPEGGARLYAHPQPMTQTDAARDAEDAKRYRFIKSQMKVGAVQTQLPLYRTLHWIGYEDCSDVRNADAAIDAEIERLDRAKGE